MTTVLTLEPLDFNLLGNTLKLQLRGKPCAGKKVIRIDYPASFAAKSIDLGVDALNKAVHEVNGPKLVFAHSQGAQVVSRWLREHASLEVIPPNELEFLLIGNPLRKYGGYIIGRPEVGGKIGLPTINDTQYHVTDLKMQYDGWADWPGDSAGALVKMNANVGKNRRHCYGYLTADLDDPNRKVYQENSTTYVMIPGSPNIPVPQSWIESSYARPER